MGEVSDDALEFARSELSGLRVEILRLIAYLLLALAVFLMAVLDFVPASSVLAVWVAIAGLAGIGMTTWWTRKKPLVAGSLASGLLGLLTIVEAIAVDSPLPLFALPLIVIASALSSGPVAATALAGILEVVVGTEVLLPGRMASPEVVRLALLFVAVSTVLGWLVTHPVRVALVWAWSSYAQIRQLADQLRARQAELARTLASLDHAYTRLEQASEELARARVAAVEARRLKAEFATGVSHELRTPLNLIIGFTEMMLFAPQTYNHEPLPPGYREDVEAIYRNTRHLATLIDDILELGEIEAGRVGLRKDRANLREIVEEAVAIVGTLLEDKHLTVDLDVPNDLPILFVDRTRVRQVFINLLNNAARFTDVGGITIRARQGEREVVVTVADTGVGIGPRDLPHVFEEFRQFDTALLRRAGGSGLGLSICKRFVELHGGTIRVESVPGEGTIFTFSLPLVDSVASQAMREAWDTWARLGPARPADNPTVLVASANPMATRLFERHLDSFRIVTPEDQEAQPESGRVHGLIYVLGPGQSLESIGRTAPTTGDDVPVLVCQLPSERDLSRELGVADYLVKPFRRDRLLQAVRRAGTRVRTILVLDDDPAMVDLVTRTILSTGPDYTVLKAFDGKQALDVLRGRDPEVDLLIMDLLVPPPDGFALLETIRADARLAELPVIVLSARGFLDHGITSSLLAVTRRGGLSVAELMACARALLRISELRRYDNGAAPATCAGQDRPIPPTSADRGEQPAG